MYARCSLRSSAADDDPTDIRLTETGPNTGIFVSKSQLLTTRDLPGIPAAQTDDGFAMHDGFTGPVADNAAGDRTHHTEIDGAVRVSFVTKSVTQVSTIPVFQRAPDYRKELHLRVHVFNEPYLDVGYDHDGDPLTPDLGVGNHRFDFTDSNGNGRVDAGERAEPNGGVSGDGILNTVLGTAANATAHVNAQVERANIAWAQAGIRVVLDGGVTFEDAPGDAATGTNILLDKEFNFPADNDRVVAKRPAGSVSPDVYEVFFTAPMNVSEGQLGRSVDRGSATAESRKVRTPQSMVPGNTRDRVTYRIGPQTQTASASQCDAGKGEKAV